MADAEPSTTPDPESDPNTRRERLGHAYRVGLGLICADPWFAVLAFAALAAVPIAGEMIRPAAGESLVLAGIGAAVRVTVIYLITIRWYGLLGAATVKVGRSIAPTVAFGFALWLILRGPFLILQLERVPGTWVAPLLLILGPAAYFNLKYFFYHIPLAAGWRGSLHKSFRFATHLTGSNLLLPVRVLIGPAAVTLLLTGLIGAASPDGREGWVAYAVAAAEQVFWLLTPYLACAYATFLIPDQDWRDLGLDPYRSARITTLAVQGPELAAKQLRPKNAAIILFIGLFVWLGNVARISELPPAVSISVERVAVGDLAARVEIAVSGTPDHFRGFVPQFFRIAGEQGTPIAPSPAEIESTLAPGQTAGRIELGFVTELTEANIRKIKDLHLWYLRARLMRLDFEHAEKIEPNGTQ